jgi:hypothetical protein
MTTHRPSKALACSLLGSLLCCCSTAAERPAGADHLWWEEDLVDHVAPEKNAYGSNPSHVTWAGVGEATEYENRSVCTSFLTLSLEQARGWTSADVQAWLGSPSPTAARYHDAIVAEDGFSRVATIGVIAPGDIIAIRYPEGGPVTGHAASAASAATPRVATKPLIDGTSQYELTVIDSSRTGHGPTDTRRRPDGSWHQGAGRGVLRLYGDADDHIVGYTWSTYTFSEFHPLSERHLAVGRLP